MDKSLKLKLFGPKLVFMAKEAQEGASFRKPKGLVKEGGCIAANGDDASIILTKNIPN